MSFSTSDFHAYLPLAIGDGQGSPPVEMPYTIPPDNPFVGQSGYREEIWALGLRNPWRISFDQQTGDLFLGDVGQGNWEIDFQPASSDGGQNYGWNILKVLRVSWNLIVTRADDPPVQVYATHADGNCSTGLRLPRGQYWR
jgi:hypothetical protein